MSEPTVLELALRTLYHAAQDSGRGHAAEYAAPGIGCTSSLTYTEEETE